VKRQIAGRIVKPSETFLLLTGGSPAAELSGNQPQTIRFELRLASLKKVGGWKIVPAPFPGIIWISPEGILTKADIAQAWPDRTADELCIGVLLTEDGL